MKRRTLLAAIAMTGAVPRLRAASIDTAIVARNDEVVANYLERQNLDESSRWYGAIPDATGLHNPGSAAGILLRGSASYHHPDSRYHEDAELRERIRVAAAHLERAQTPDGNIDLLTTNFNSPPDLGFVIHNVGIAATIARENSDDELLRWMETFLRNAGRGLSKGGVHTPNHRWVVSAALAHVNAIYPDEAYVRRIDQWLAEGIDIDADGQYSERSTTVYNAVTDNALVEIALRLGRQELLEPVRRNLESMLYLLHPNYEVVTEISRRQDRDTIGTMSRYWLTLRYMARQDQDGRFQTLLDTLEPENASLAHLMAYAELSAEPPAPAPVPDNYERYFAVTDFVHIRRGDVSTSITPTGSSRFFAIRHGEAVIGGVRFAAAFFGKGQFVPDSGSKQGDVYHMEQALDAAYYQPFVPTREQPVGTDAWYEMRPGREATEVNRIRYQADVRELSDGFDVRIRAEGTDNVPIAVEINLREGGSLEGVEPVPNLADTYLLPAGAEAVYTRGGDRLRFGPGMAETQYTEVRGAQPKLPGPCVYLTGFTPFDHTLRIRWT